MLQTDPRLWTFDNYRHDINTAGEFVLYRHKKRNVEVSWLAVSLLYIKCIFTYSKFYFPYMYMLIQNIILLIQNCLSLIGSCFIHWMSSRWCLYLWSSYPSGRLPVCVPYLWSSVVPNCQSSCPSFYYLWSLWWQTHGDNRSKWWHRCKFLFCMCLLHVIRFLFDDFHRHKRMLATVYVYVYDLRIVSERVAWLFVYC